MVSVGEWTEESQNSQTKVFTKGDHQCPTIILSTLLRGARTCPYLVLPMSHDREDKHNARINPTEEAIISGVVVSYNPKMALSNV